MESVFSVSRGLVAEGGTVLEFGIQFFLWTGLKIIMIVLFVWILWYVTKKSSGLIKEKIIEYDGDDEHALGMANMVYEVVLYGVLVVGGAVGLYLAGFDSVFIVIGATFGTGYAFRSLFENLIAGVMVMTTKEFTPGLLLEIYIDDTIYFGKIEFVYIRYTVFRRLDMTRVIIPNRLLIRVPVMTFGEEENVRLQTSWRLHRDTDLSLSIPLMKQTINALETITEKEFTVITLDGFDDGYLHLTAYFYFNPGCGKLRYRVVSEVITALSALFREHNIVFAYPHTVVTTDQDDRSIRAVADSYAHYMALSS